MDIVPVCVPVPVTEIRMLSRIRMGLLAPMPGCLHAVRLIFALLSRARAPAFGPGTGTNSVENRRAGVLPFQFAGGVMTPVGMCDKVHASGRDNTNAKKVRVRAADIPLTTIL
jgi:hypothetical protein